MNSNMLNTSNIVSPHDALYTSSQGPYQMTSSQGPYQMTSSQGPYQMTAVSQSATGTSPVDMQAKIATNDFILADGPDIHSIPFTMAHDLGSVQLPYDVAAHSNGMVDDNYCPRFTDAADASHSFLDTDTTILTVGHGPMNTLVDMHYAA